ncbi:MAG: DUF4149 domain-containing protein [Candidatus Aminicenantes bacterium]|jgi:uncharacterized membrane protein
MSPALELVLITLMNWIHLFATVAWIGGITTMIFVVSPGVKAALEPPVIGKLMDVLVKRMKMLVYINAALLIVTGFVLQGLNPAYADYGFGSRLPAILVIKHILILIMIILGIYVSEKVGPKISKLAAKGPSPEIGRLQKKQVSIGFINFILGLLVLLLSGYMSALT